MKRPLRGIEIVITGRLSESRNAFKSMIREAGGKLCEKVYKGRTSFVVVGADRDGTPMRQGKFQSSSFYGVPQIDEGQLRRMMEG